MTGLRLGVLLVICCGYLVSAQDDNGAPASSTSTDSASGASSEAQNLVTIVDLTHETHEDGPRHPFVSRGLTRNISFVDIEDGENSRFKTEHLCLPTHFGTHVDAPCHYRGTWCVTDIPLERLVLVPASVIDIRNKVFRNGTVEADTQLTIEDIEDWEAVHGQIPGQSVVLALTGWARYWNDPERFLGGSSFETLHFPGISPKAADWIVKNRPSVYGMGVDTLSGDYGRSRKFPTHNILTKANMYIIENLANLNRLPATGALINVGVLKIGREASGGPARITATYSSRAAPRQRGPPSQ